MKKAITTVLFKSKKAENHNKKSVKKKKEINKNTDSLKKK